jgi:hypothetical protein
LPEDAVAILLYDLETGSDAALGVAADVRIVSQRAERAARILRVEVDHAVLALCAYNLKGEP